MCGGDFLMRKSAEKPVNQTQEVKKVEPTPRTFPQKLLSIVTLGMRNSLLTIDKSLLE